MVMERLHCSLTKLLEDNSDITLGRKLFIVCDVARELKYLHTRAPPIIHRDLSSNNVLISKRMEGKIGDLGAARLVDPQRQSQMTKAPGTVVFMPPEALEDRLDIHYGKELDVFSFGCVMLHTLSHQWPAPLPAVVTDPETGVVKGGRSEVERRSEYFDKIDKSIAGVLIPLTESCLNNLPKKRTSIVRVCDKLEDLVDRQCVPIDDMTVSALQDEIQRKENEYKEKILKYKKSMAIILRCKLNYRGKILKYERCKLNYRGKILKYEKSKGIILRCKLKYRGKMLKYGGKILKYKRKIIKLAVKILKWKHCDLRCPSCKLLLLTYHPNR